MKIALDGEMINALRALRFQGNKATMPQLERKTYERVNKVLEAAGGKWSRKDKSHVFDSEDAQETLAEAITLGEIVDHKAIAKKVFQYFQTPEPLAARMAEELCIDGPRDPKLTILEPSAGGGRLVEACYKRNPGNVHVTAVEMDQKRAPDLVEQFGVGLPFTCYFEDFTDTARIGVSRGSLYDRVIMNPPFRHGQDIGHFMLAWKLLKPGGRIVAITAPGWTFRNDAKHSLFRQMIEKNEGGDFKVETLPENTFKESGTTIRTMLIIGDKL